MHSQELAVPPVSTCNGTTPRQEPSPAKGRVPVFLVMALFAFGSACSSVMASEAGSLKLIIDMFSGVPNPELILQQAEAALVAQMISEATPAPGLDLVLPPYLGYRGVIVEKWRPNGTIESSSGSEEVSCHFSTHSHDTFGRQGRFRQRRGRALVPYRSSRARSA
jgi:hypothetical protein